MDIGSTDEEKVCFVEESEFLQQLDKEKIFWIMNVFILFLYAVDIFGFPNKLAIVWIGIVGVYYWKNQNLINFDIKFFLLTLAMVFHAVIFKYYSPDFSITLTLSLAVVPILFYLLGRQLIGVASTENNYEDKAEVVTLVITIGMFVHALLNFYAWTQGHDGKLWDDFWPDVLCTVTTQHSFLAVAAGGLFAYGIYYITKKWYISVVTLFMALTVNIINIIYDNRMVLAISIVVLGMNAVIYMYLNRKSKKAWYTVGGALLVIVIGLVLIFGLNLGNIRESQYIYNLVNRDGGIVNNIRFKYQASAITQLLSHWRGGVTMELPGTGFAHNYWLDMANHTGLASFIPMVLFTVGTLVDMVRLILSDYVSNRLKYLLPSVFISIFLYHCMEPGGIARPDYILYLTIMAGIIYQTRKCMEENRTLK